MRGAGRPARGRREVDDDERRPEPSAPAPTRTRAPVSRNASLSATNGCADGAATSAFSTRSGARRRTVARFSNRISGGERVRRAAHEVPVDEDEARAGGGEAERPEAGLQLDGLGALGDRDVARGEAEDRPCERQEVRVAPLLVRCDGKPAFTNEATPSRRSFVSHGGPARPEANSSACVARTSTPSRMVAARADPRHAQRAAAAASFSIQP